MLTTLHGWRFLHRKGTNSMSSVIVPKMMELLVGGRPNVKISIVLSKDGDVELDKFVWESDTEPKPTDEEILQALSEAKRYSYQDSRRMAYPSVLEQLDTLFHEGYEGWRESIQAVKDQFPKPPPA